MKYDDLARAVADYERISYYDSNYWPYLRYVEREWNKPSVSLAEAILDFLNKWRMRIPKTPDLLKRIAATTKDAQPYVATFRHFRIEDCDLHSVVTIGSEQLGVQTAVLYVFEMFHAVGSRFVDVAAAKTLHLFAPGFFVIWDSSTQSNLTPARGSFAWRYATVFLPRVQADINALIEETQGRFGLTRAQSIEKLETLGKNRKTIAKLADEYYYSRFTKGLFRRKAK